MAVEFIDSDSESLRIFKIINKMESNIEPRSKNMIFHRGEIYVSKSGYWNSDGYYEYNYKAIVIQGNNEGEYRDYVTIVPIRKNKGKNTQWFVYYKDSELIEDYPIDVFAMRTVKYNELTEQIGKIQDSEMRKIDEMIIKSLGIII